MMDELVTQSLPVRTICLLLMCQRNDVSLQNSKRAKWINPNWCRDGLIGPKPQNRHVGMLNTAGMVLSFSVDWLLALFKFLKEPQFLLSWDFKFTPSLKTLTCDLYARYIGKFDISASVSVPCFLDLSLLLLPM